MPIEAPRSVYAIGSGIICPYQSQPDKLITSPKDLESVVFDPDGSLVGELPFERRITSQPSDGGVIGNFFSGEYSPQKRPNHRDVFASLAPYDNWPLPKRLYTFGETLAVVTTLRALASAGISPDKFDGSGAWIPKTGNNGKSLRVAVGFTNSTGPWEIVVEGVHDDVTRKNSARLARSVMPGYVNSAIRETIHAGGHSILHHASCSTGLFNLDDAYRRLRHGEADLAIVGAFEIAATPLWLYAFNHLGAFADYQSYKDRPWEAAKPFSRNAESLAFGEGSVAIILATGEAIQTLGLAEKNILAEITGSNTGQDGKRLDPPDEPHELVRVQIDALNMAGIPASKLDCVINHATGTQRGDLHDWKASRTVFQLPQRKWGDPEDLYHDGYPDFTPPKSKTTHTYSPSGLFSLLTLFSAIQRQEIPGARSHITSPHGLVFNGVFGPSKRRSVEHGIVCSYGMDSTAAAVIVHNPSNVTIFRRDSP